MNKKLFWPAMAREETPDDVRRGCMTCVHNAYYPAACNHPDVTHAGMSVLRMIVYSGNGTMKQMGK